MSPFRIFARLLVLFIVFFSTVFFFNPAVFADSYQLNPESSQIDFQFYHLNSKEKIKGTFTNFEIDISLDNSKEIEFLNITIDAARVIGKNGKTDLLLKEKFFDTEMYNKITFRSESIENLSRVSWVTGELNIKDNVRKVILKLYKKKIATTRSFEESYTFSGKIIPKDFPMLSTGYFFAQ